VSTSLSEAVPEALKNLHTRPLFVLREQVPPLLVVGQTPNAFRRIGVIQGGYMRDPDGYLIEVGQTTLTAGPLDSYA
jgi:hypothetical protein